MAEVITNMKKNKLPIIISLLAAVLIISGTLIARHIYKNRKSENIEQNNEDNKSEKRKETKNTEQNEDDDDDEDKGNNNEDDKGNEDENNKSKNNNNTSNNNNTDGNSTNNNNNNTNNINPNNSKKLVVGSENAKEAISKIKEGFTDLAKSGTTAVGGYINKDNLVNYVGYPILINYLSKIYGLVLTTISFGYL